PSPTHTFTVTPTPTVPLTTHFSVVSGASKTAGVAFPVTVIALESSGVTDTNYGGTVHFTCPGLVAPPDSTLTAGMSAFSFTATTATSYPVSVMDSFWTSIVGGQVITVVPGSLSKFVVSIPSGYTQ